MRLSLKLFFVFLFVLAFSAHAGEFQTTKTSLESGLNVVITEMPQSPMVTVSVLVKTGSATEGKFLGSGISHFLEHMFFKGTQKRPVGTIAREVEALGGSIGASTSFDYTIYNIDIPVESFPQALDVMADMMQNGKMDPQEVEKEREVIYGEMRFHNDNPTRRLFEQTFQTVYLRHPYRHPIIGYKSLFSQISRDDLLAYYTTHYSPDNMVLSIAGGVNTKEVLAQVREQFKEFKRKTPVVRNLPPEPAQISPRRSEEEYATDVTRLSMSYPSVALLNPDLYALDVLATILGQGRSSRLYQSVYKDQELVYTISASNYTPLDRGIFHITSEFDYENTEEVIAAITEQIDLIKDRGVKEAELAKAKQQALADYVFSHQTTFEVSRAKAFDQAYTGDSEFSDKYLDGIRQVSPADIKRVAKKYLVDSALTVNILKPLGSTEKESEQEPGTAGEIQRHVLENGLTVLLREDPTLPLVSINLVANAGTRLETIQTNGVSQLTALSWVRGTKSKSEKDIARFTESRGVSLSGFSGKNSFGIQMSSLSDQADSAFVLLEELVKRPAFAPAELDKVKEQMRLNIRQREDSIFSFTSYTLKQNLFALHPFRFDESGTVESLNLIAQSDVIRFYVKTIVPQNMVLSVFGDIDAADTLRRIEKLFGSLEGEALDVEPIEAFAIKKAVRKDIVLDKEQAMVLLGFQGAGLLEDDRYTLEVLSALIGGSSGARMFSNIRDKLSYAYALGAGAHPSVDTGMIYFYVLTSPDSVENVIKLLNKELQTISTTPVSDQELADTKMYLKGRFKSQRQSNASLSFLSSLDELYGLGFDAYNAFDETIDAMTKEDILRVSKQYLDPKKGVLIVTKPLSKANQTVAK